MVIHCGVHSALNVVALVQKHCKQHGKHCLLFVFVRLFILSPSFVSSLFSKKAKSRWEGKKEDDGKQMQREETTRTEAKRYNR